MRADALPMGIDFERFSKAGRTSSVRRQVSRIRNRVGDRPVILSIDRLDYTKGILQRLEAFDAYLDKHPRQASRLELILVAVPSRTRVEHYRQLKSELDALVGRVNGKHATMDWSPVTYLYRSLPFNQLVGLYCAADVALITPLRDGMNLIAKEYVAARCGGGGVIILSEMAGAAVEMGEALIVNPNSQDGIVSAIEQALAMPLEEQAERIGSMCSRLESYDVKSWAHDFVDTLSAVKKEQRKLEGRKLGKQSRAQLLDDYRGAKHRLLLLDYDGTLMPFAARADRVRPDAEVLGLLAALAADDANEVVVISGRVRRQMEDWFGHLRIGLMAEHGGWLREVDQAWRPLEHFETAWKTQVRPMLDLFVRRTPGSFVEEKDLSLVWHYRAAEAALAAGRAQELKDALASLVSNIDATVVSGNKIVEVRNAHVDKGRGARYWLSKDTWDYVVAIGDDRTDEDCFAVLPDRAWSLKVGLAPSVARYSVESVADVRLLLQELVDPQPARAT